MDGFLPNWRNLRDQLNVMRVSVRRVREDGPEARPQRAAWVLVRRAERGALIL